MRLDALLAVAIATAGIVGIVEAKPITVRITTIHGDYGGRELDSIGVVLNALLEPIAACARQEQKRGTPPDRLFGVTLSVTPKGLVGKVDVMLGSWPKKKPAYTQCLAKALQKAVFAPSGRTAQIKAMFELER